MILRACTSVALLLTVAFAGNTVNAQARDTTKAPPAKAQARDTTKARPGYTQARDTTKAQPANAQARDTTKAHPAYTQARDTTKARPGYAQARDTTKAQPASQEEMMKRWQEAATPGEAHKALSTMLGKWEATVSTWPKGPDQPAAVSKGTSENSSVLVGRFVKQEFSGEMMGMPMSGIGYTGYDNIKKKFVSVWLDNTSTAMHTTEGTIDQSGKVLTLVGTMDDPMTGEKNKKVKYVTRILDADNHVFEMYDLSKGNEQKVVEIKYTRKHA